MNNEMPLVSIIFVTYNGRDDFEKCLNSLRNQTYTNYEIIAVDNGSQIEMVQFLESKKNEIEFVNTKKNNGFGAGNNIGLNKSKGSLIVFTNYDAEFDSMWLERLVDTAISSDDIGIVAPKILMYDKRDIINTCGVYFSYLGFACSDGLNEKTFEYEKRKNIASASGCCFLIRRSVLEVIGGFDEEFHRFGKEFYFSSLEDIDLSWRVHTIGKRVVFEPLSIMYHKYFQKALSPIRYQYLECGRLYILAKNYNIMTLFLLSPVLILFEIMTWFYALIKGPGFILKKIVSYYVMLFKVRILIRRRSELKKIRKVDDCYIMQNLGTAIKLRHLPLPDKIIEIIEIVPNMFFSVYKKLVQKIIKNIGQNKILQKI